MKRKILRAQTLLLKCLLLILLSGCVAAQNRDKTDLGRTDRGRTDRRNANGMDVHALNRNLGRGINLGNMFEAPREGDWGPHLDPAWFARLRQRGFQHVRIPVRWDTPERTQQDPPYPINPEFLQRINHIVDAALAQDLHVILNMHHHDPLFEDPHAHSDRFLAQWQQVADHFQHHPPTLLFEVLNEPHNNLTPERWNVLFRDALAKIRRHNPARAVLLGTPNWGGPGSAKLLTPPDDPYLILTIHYYLPFPFTHQGAEWVEGSTPWLGTEWHDTAAERAAVIHSFQPVFDLAREHQLPVHIGEFGAYARADMESRIRWTGFLARWFEEQGFSWAYWELAAGFGILDPETGTFREPLLDALLHRPMPPPARALRIYHYRPDADAPPPKLTVNHPDVQVTQVNAIPEAEGLNLHIHQGGTQDWHVQFIHAPVTLRQGRQYELSARLYADPPREIILYSGRNQAPWNAYSPYHRAEIPIRGRTIRLPFVHQNENDPAARIVLDLTPQPGTLRLTNFQLIEMPE